MKFQTSLAIRPSLTLVLALSGVCFHASLFEAKAGQDLKTYHNQISSQGVLTSDQKEQLADRVLAIILTYSLKTDIDAESIGARACLKKQEGISELKKEILRFIQKSQPIRFTLVGFPFKSGNKEKKVIGDLPDLAERLALEKLHRFVEDISKVYPYGAKLNLYTDGLAFFDVLGIPLEKVLQYEASLKTLAADLPLISIITCQDLFPNSSPVITHAAIKAQVIPCKELSQAEEDVLCKRLLKEFDSFKGRSVLKKKTIHQLARELDHRSRQINHIYKSKFPSSIHLSVHYQKNLGKKVGFSLSPGKVTPWHGVAVLHKDNSFMIQPKEDIPEKARLSFKIINRIICYYYICD